MKARALLPMILLLAVHAGAADVFPRNSEPGNPMPAPDALRTMKLPEGFTATVFSAEPSVRQPIDMKVDARGRVWVAESYSYMSPSSRAQDRVIVLSDTNDNGMADQRNFFASGLRNLTSIEIGFGGVWVLAPPNLMFYPDADGDMKPDAPPVVHLMGWNPNGRWNMANGLTFGPDGWLYGRIGQLGASNPRTVSGDSPGRISSGIWRYHPQNGKFEVMAHGMTNAWGLDWNEDGEMFVSGNCNGHLWHIVGGSLYDWGFGARGFPYEYGRTLSVEAAPHYSPGKDWWTSWQQRFEMADANDAYGGGHSHSGLLICNGSAWPEKMRGHTLMSNIHGGRINEDTLEASGSSYISRRVGDPIRPKDDWFRAVSLVAAPDGAFYVSDWSDTGECHDESGIHQNSGRIYRMLPMEKKPIAAIDSMDEPALISLLEEDREEPARQALKQLQHRALEDKLAAESKTRLGELLSHADFRTRLRALSVFHGGGMLSEKEILTAAKDSDERVRAMAVRYWAEGKQTEATRAFFLEMAGNDPSPRVMLHLASVTRLLDRTFATAITNALTGRTSNPIDARTAQLLWHIQIQKPVFTSFDARRLIVACRSAAFAAYPARYLVENDGDAGLASIFEIAASMEHPAVIVSAAVDTARTTQGFMSPPADWPTLRGKWLTSQDANLRTAALSAAILFGDTDALNSLKATIDSPDTTIEEKSAALETLAAAQTDQSIIIVGEAAREKTLRKAAIRALRHFKQSSIAESLLGNWETYDEDEQRAAIETLVSRREWALPLLTAIGSGKIASTSLTAAQASGLVESGDPQLKAAVLKHWGNPARTGSQKDAAMARATAILTEGPSGDPTRGRLLFSQSCGSCHTLYGEGGKLGPDLTGRNRSDLASLVRSIVDPSADVPEDGRHTVVTRTDGSMASGVILSKSSNSVTLRGQQGDVVIPHESIATLRTQETSPMPEGLLDALTDEQLRDLFSYLRADQAAPPK